MSHYGKASVGGGGADAVPKIVVRIGGTVPTALNRDSAQASARRHSDRFGYPASDKFMSLRGLPTGIHGLRLARPKTRNTFRRTRLSGPPGEHLEAVQLGWRMFGS